MTEEQKQFVRENLSYDANTGVITWLSSVGSVRVNSEAGNTNKATGYVIIGCLGRYMKAHRLAWFLYYGIEPEDQIDHINGIRVDNRITNLRVATHQENMKNQRKPVNNKSSIVGVSWHKPTHRWQVSINTNNKRKHLGYFGDFFEAVCVRKSAEIRYNYSERHGK